MDDYVHSAFSCYNTCAISRHTHNDRGRGGEGRGGEGRGGRLTGCDPGPLVAAGELHREVGHHSVYVVVLLCCQSEGSSEVELIGLRCI